MRDTWRAAVLGTAVLLTVSACASAAERSGASSSGERATGTTASASGTPAPDVGTVITATIAGGTVTPVNGEAEAVVGRPIVLEVRSDAPDSIHVHSVPEHVFEVAPGPAQRFEFTVDVPGRVDVELHDLNRTIVTITVRA